MKKIFLALVVALTVFSVQAQKTKEKQSSKSSKSKAEYARKAEERQEKLAMQRMDMLEADSLRKLDDSLSMAKLSFERDSFKTKRAFEIDSVNSSKYKTIAADQEQYSLDARSSELIYKEAKLGAVQGRQVSDINRMYAERAMLVRDDLTKTDEQRKAEYTALNAERRMKIQAILGKGKERKLEKERQDYTTKNATGFTQNWISMAMPVENKK